MLKPEVTREDTSISLSTLLYLLLYSSMLKKPSSQSLYGNGKLAHWRTWITLLQTRKPMFDVASNLRLTPKSYLQAHKCKYKELRSQQTLFTGLDVGAALQISGRANAQCFMSQTTSQFVLLIGYPRSPMRQLPVPVCGLGRGLLQH